MNGTPTAAVHGMTPEEWFTGKKPDVSHLKVFGCIAYVHVPDELRKKLDPKAEKCIFIGYSLEQKGYRCYNPVTSELRVSRDVIFDDMSSCWYASSGDALKDDDDHDNAVQIEKKESQSLSGPETSLSSGQTASP